MLTRAIVIYANGQDTMMTSSVIGSNAYPEGDICMHLLDALLNGTVNYPPPKSSGLVTAKS